MAITVRIGVGGTTEKLGLLRCPDSFLEIGNRVFLMFGNNASYKPSKSWNVA